MALNVYDQLNDLEFYPELLSSLSNAIIGISNGQEYRIVDRLLSNIQAVTPRESLLHHVLEDFDTKNSTLDLNAIELRKILDGLYWEQIQQCLPEPLKFKLDVLHSLYPFLQMERHPDLFSEDVSLYSYVPNLVLRQIHMHTNADRNQEEDIYTVPMSSDFVGACLLVDISGFTKLSGECCGMGALGLDVLHQTTSGFLGKFIQTVYMYHGDGM